MIEIKNKVNCSGCEACLNICPKNCITMVEDDEGFRYPKVDKEKCINCHLCEKICPILNKYKSNNKGYLVYGAINKNKKILRRSTSGGVFYQLAKKVIEEKNGVVFGVRFDADNNAVFDYAEDMDKVIQFLGSKYVQARVGNIYRKVKECLENKKTVLFSGCPCQVAGLKSFLRKDYDNLYTCDFVCEGVPNEKLLNIFKEHYEKKYHSKIKNINFRYKKYGWKYFGYLLTFENNKKLYLPRNEVNYMNMLFGLIYVRPSCYECKFRELNSGSDFKLADFWEVNNSRNTKYNFYGVSHFLINTKKGEELFKGIEKEIDLYESNLDEIKKLNNTFNTQVFDNKGKHEFLKKIKNKNNDEIFKVMETYNNLTFLNKIKFRLKLKLVKIKYSIKKHI